MVGALVAALLWFPAWHGVHRHRSRLVRRVRELESQLKQPNSLIAETTVAPLQTSIAEPEVVVPRRVTAHVDEEPV
jgi:hypothetical protein